MEEEIGRRGGRKREIRRKGETNRERWNEGKVR